jgi:hypothetical protein
MATNKSKVYGYYGGVTNANHYIPPDSPSYIPQPATNFLLAANLNTPATEDTGELEIEAPNEITNLETKN